MTALDEARVTFDQDVWWCPADGLTRLIDDLEDRHRANIAGWLVKHAAAFHLQLRLRQLAFTWMAYGGYDGDGPEWEIPTEEEDRDTIRREQDRGEHLDWVRATPLFRRMIRDLPESALPPGTLRPLEEAAREDFA